MRFSFGNAAAGTSCCLLLSTLRAISSFSYFNPQPHHNFQNYDTYHEHEASDGFDMQPSNPSPYQSDKEALASKRRNFFSKVTATTAAATAFSAVSSPPPAYAVTEAPTRIELTVETDYLIRVLNYFDGDMRKVLGAIVRSPLTSVEIEPPRAGFNFGGGEAGLSPKDAILRALYSYGNPEEYAAQSRWLKVDAPNPWIEFLTKKRYELEIPFFYAKEGEKKGSIKKIVVKPATALSLSNIEAAIGIAALSYPVAYAYYNYESWQEEQEKLAKKKMMAAKKAKGKAKEGASKGSVKKEGVSAAVEDGDAKASKKTAMKGQVAKAKRAKQPFPKRPLSQSEQEEATMAPNAMTEALNEIFGIKSGITAVVSDVEPSTEVKPPKYQKQQAELIDHLEFVEQKETDSQPNMENEQKTGQQMLAPQSYEEPLQNPELPSPPPEIQESLYMASQKVKRGNGGMDAYEAQMRALMNQSKN